MGAALKKDLRDMRRDGVSFRTLATRLGVTKTSVSRWATGEKEPAADRMADVELAIRELRAGAPRASTGAGGPPRPAKPTRLRLVGNGDDSTTMTPPPSTPDEETPMQISREYLTPDEMAFFGLERDPFEEGDDPDDVWMPPHLRSIESALFAAIRRRDVVALVGAPGAGKSTLLRRLWLRGSREKRVRLIAPATLDRRQISAGTLASAILRDVTGADVSTLGAERRSELLAATLAEQAQQGQFPTLVIDEAHLMNSSALLAIKHIWDSHTLFRQLAVILVGQLPLRDRLRRDPTVRELTGRTRILELPTLAKTTGDYLTWRFDRVGAKVAGVIDARAIDAIALRAENPLWVGNLCVAAMRYAHESGDRRVLAEHVGRV